ncbi:TadE/TadG family type IV pilus assembly protein [Microbacterium sp. Leaf320]|uniref:TadE/TadG family type IV pilus assembly protein n=1 Tax=Microbacterium sp. Leaf320 TaxID=1736334 RepID=UPI0006F987D8|nr:TadE/TadG family type IV pilus assembly protein [Microbacterium sp. Leaf320]KQQ65686.1 TadE family protein [Microbacterium sp. Leaf320]
MPNPTIRRRLLDERGSSPVEFVMVGTLLTLLTLAVMQLALAVYVRNVVHDSAVEGAYHAALADTSLEDGAERARAQIVRAVGDAYAEDVTIGRSTSLGQPTIDVRVRTTLPVIGLIGIPFALEVEAHAPEESFGDG